MLRMGTAPSAHDADAMPAIKANSRSNEVDCGDCVGRRRCWGAEAVPGAGFMVRRLRLLPAGEALFDQDSPFDAPCIVTRGCIAVTELLDDGRERIVAFRVPGEIVGLESWNRARHRYGAYAIAESTLCRLRWQASGSRNPAVLRALLTKATTQSADTTMPWAGLPAAERVAAFLEDFRSRTDQPLPMTRAQIGQYLGLAEETVVRAFKALIRR